MFTMIARIARIGCEVRRGLLLYVAVTLATLAPLWIFKYPPASDLPNHVAITSIIERLLNNDPVVSAYYALNLQSTPYYLYYVLALPLVAWLGPLVGTKIVITFSGLAFMLAAWAILAERERPRFVMLLVPLIVYNVSFFYGFLLSYTGLPLVLLSYWALLRHGATAKRRFVFLAALAGVLAVAAHVLMLAPYLALLAGYALADRMKRWRTALVLGLVGLLPCVPWLMKLLFAEGPSSMSLGEMYHHLLWFAVQQAQLFDRGLGRAALIAALSLCALVVAWSFIERSRDASRGGRITAFGMAALVLGAWSVMYVVTPVEASAWGLNFRFMPLLAVAGLAVMPKLARPALRRVTTIAAAALLVLYLSGLYVFWYRFDRATRRFDDVLACMQKGRALTTIVNPKRFLSAWVPVDHHMHAYYVASGGAYDDLVFSGGHIPIKNIRVPLRDDDLGEYDYLLVQGESPVAIPRGAKLLCAAGIWRLYEKAP